MSIRLPGFLSETLALTGVHWPDIEEDDLRGIATALDRFAGEMRDHRDGVTGQLAATSSVTTAQSFDALVTHWASVAHGPVEDALHTVQDISRGLHVAAELVSVCKVGVIAEVSRLAAEIAAAEASVFGSVSIPGLIAASRAILTRLVDQLEQEAIRKVSDELLGKLVGDIESHVDRAIDKTMQGLVRA